MKNLIEHIVFFKHLNEAFLFITKKKIFFYMFGIWFIVLGYCTASFASKLVAFGDIKFNQREKGPIRLMEAGARFGLVLKTNGQLVAWGVNSNGECEVPGGNDFTAISCGMGHALALKTNGAIVAWGDNRSNQYEVPDENDFIAISSHRFYNVALRSDGTIVTWGDNTYHPGPGAPPGYQESTIDLPDSNDNIGIAAGYYHGLALKSDGSIVAWGNNGYNQCEVPDGNDFIAIAAGEFHSIALRKDGQLSVWGNNYYGQCDVPDGNDYVDTTAGGLYNVALKSDGTIVFWGDMEGNGFVILDDNDFVAISACGDYCLGQRKDGSIIQLTQGPFGKDIPHPFNRDTTGDYIGIASGYFELALSSDGTIVAWGSYNDHGELNIPDGNDFIDIAAGNFHGIALRSNGNIESWGWNGYGQLDVPEANDYIALASGSHHCVAIRSPGTLVAWGANHYGQCNVPDGDDFVNVAGGGGHSLALRSNGSLVAWGANDYGQCDVPDGNDFVVVASGGGAVSCALKSDGTIIAWGYNDLGRLDVPLGKDFVAISENISCLALTSNGRIVPWGSWATQWNIPDYNDFTAVVSAMHYGLAIIEGEAVSCFGVNHVKLETKAGKKGNKKVELKGTFSPALPIDFARDDVIYIIDDGQGHMLSFVIPAGSFEPEGEPEKQRFKFDSPKHSQPDIKAKFDFLKCKFELRVKGVMDTSEITGDNLAIVLQAGENPANLVEEVVQVQVKRKHLEYRREPKLSCCPKCMGIALLEVTSTDPFTGDEYVLLFEPEPGKEKLKRKTVVDDWVNRRVKIDTSCSKPLEVGDVFGAYTVTELIKIFDDLPDDDNDE